MRFRLRTLLILLAVGPPLLAAPRLAASPLIFALILFAVSVSALEWFSIQAASSRLK